MSLKSFIKKSLTNPLGITSPYYAQGKEDQSIAKIFENLQNGFYIDIGSHHPVSYSNTNYFYERGWRGICIDPNGLFAPLYAHRRPQDRFLNLAVSDYNGEASFYSGMYDVHSSLLKSTNNSLVETKVVVKDLKTICKENNVPSTFELLSIDTEGTEINVLNGLDFQTHKPRLILVEYNTAGNINLLLQPYLLQKGYQLVMINEWNMLFSCEVEADLRKLYAI